MKALFGLFAVSALMGAIVVNQADAKQTRSSYSKRTKRYRGSGVISLLRSVGSDGECSCQAHKICYGPRGGRYCLTSGGNKRYGV